MVKALAFCASLVMVSLGSAAAQTMQPPSAPADRRPTFTAAIELVALNVTVTDASEGYVPGLVLADFQVFEDGVQQDLAFFGAGAVPIDLAILLDTSASMSDRMALVQEAAGGFVRSLRPGDRGMVVAFNDTARVLQSLTPDLNALTDALHQTSGRGATALYNAVYVTLKEFARLARENTEVRRQAIVVLTDGQDTASVVSFEQVLDLARRQSVNIYTISATSPDAAQGAGRSRYFSEAQYAMKTLARESGARAFWPSRIEDLNGVYEVIADELAHQYSLGYTSKNPRQDGAFRRIVVRIASRPGAHVRARTGYFAPTPLQTASAR